MKKIVIVVLVLFGIVALFWIHYRINLSSREKAETWYQFRNGPQGSVEKQYYLQKSIDADSSFAKAYFEKSVAFNKRGHYAEGMNLLNKAVSLSPTEYLGYRGHIKLYMLRDYKGALNDFSTLNPLTPNFRDSPWGEDIYHVIGLTYKQLKKYDSAVYYFQHSINSIIEEEGDEWVNPQTYFLLWSI